MKIRPDGSHLSEIRTDFVNLFCENTSRLMGEKGTNFVSVGGVWCIRSHKVLGIAQ